MNDELDAARNEALSILREAMRAGDVGAAKAVLAYAESKAPSHSNLPDPIAARDHANAERKARLEQWKKDAYLIETGSSVVHFEDVKTKQE